MSVKASFTRACDMDGVAQDEVTSTSFLCGDYLSQVIPNQSLFGRGGKTGIALLFITQKQLAPLFSF